MANEYLTRQPTSSGNSRRWTISFWMKNSDPTQGYTAIMGAGKVSPTNVYNEIFYNGSQTGLNLDNSSASDNYNITANPLLRDPSAWMHVIVSFTDQGDNANTRIKFYINGAFVDHNTGTALDVSETSFFNHKDYIHYIGSRAQQSYGGTTFDAQYFDVFLVDGQALTPDVFGFYKEGKGYQSSGSSDSTDFGPGQWSPHSPRKIKSEIERKGGFGVNGFYLPMNDSSNPGADFHCDPNSIIKLKGEDLPQPRNGAPTTSDAYVSQVRKEIGELGFAGCVKFDGTDDYLTVPSSADFAFGTGDFTIEAFCYRLGGFFSIFDHQMGLGNFTIFSYTNGPIQVYNNAFRSSGVNPGNKRWFHLAVVRQSGTLSFYIDGVKASTTHSFSLNFTTAGVNIGSTGYGERSKGFVSNLRVIKGTALYTSDFTPPTSPLTNVSNTKLLCCQSSTSATAAAVIPTGSISAVGGAHATTSELTGSIVCAVPGIAGGLANGYGDYSASIKGTGTNKSVTASGNIEIASFHSYYGSGMRFSGSGVSSSDGGLLQLASVEDFTLSTGDFTLEGWLYAHVNGQDSGVFGVGSGGQEPFLSWTNGILKFRYSGGTALTFNQTMAHNQWHHVALERHSGKISLIVNGVVAATGINNTSFSQGAFLIGSWTSSRAYGFNGEIQDVRLYKGIAKYKGGFDVSKPYTPVGIENFRTVSDTCKNNFATLSPIDNNGGVLSNGNLTYGDAGSDGWNNSRATIGASSGKWYWEMRVDAINQVICASVAGPAGNDTTNGARLGFLPGQTDDAGVTYYDDGRLYHADSQTGGQAGWGSTYGATDVIGIALDMDDSGGKVWFSKNGSWQASGNPSTGANPARSNLKTYADTYFPASGTYFANTTQTFNFGQNLTFSDILANKGNRLNSANNSWTLTHGGSQGNFTVADDGVTLSGTTASSAYMRATYTLDPKKKYIISFKYTAGANNTLAIQDDKGYITTTDGTATTALQVGNHYAAVISASTSVVITATNWNTSYTINNIHLSEYDAGYTDDSGKGKFQYQPPTGFLALCEDNLPTPAITDPGKHFKCVTYTGDGGVSKSISGVGFKPDFVWLKCRNQGKWHALVDSVRGNTKTLFSNDTSAEVSETHVPSFNSDGFTVADIDSGTANQPNFQYVAWCWKAGGAAVTNTDGTITSQVSVNRDAGFSVATWTGTGTGSQTIGHGLGKAPDFYIWKSRDNAREWHIAHKGLTAYNYTLYFTSAGEVNNDKILQAPSSTVIYPSSSNTLNGSGEDYVGYFWTEIEGYSKFGTYFANGNVDGNFVYCGFKPAWLMIKPYGSGNGCYSAGYSSWSIYDSSRSPVNNSTMHERVLFANRAYEEGKRGQGSASGAFQNIDLLSNGFKLRGNSNCEVNTSSIDGFIFVAFAESPFHTANAK